MNTVKKILRQSLITAFFIFSIAPVIKAQNLSSTVSPKQLPQLVTVKTAAIKATINLVGGNIQDIKLLKFPKSIQENHLSFNILEPKQNNAYHVIADIHENNPDSPKKTIVFHTNSHHFETSNNQQQIRVTLTGQTANGLKITKTYTFKENSYAIASQIKIHNTNHQPWSGYFFNVIEKAQSKQKNSAFSRSYVGGALSSPEDNYQKLTFTDMKKQNVSFDLPDGWVAFQQRYFINAWIAPKNQSLHYFSQTKNNAEKSTLFTLGYKTTVFSLAPNDVTQFNSTLYAGPLIANNLSPLAKGLDDAVTNSFLGPLPHLLFSIIRWINGLIGNWGWSIVITAILIKCIFIWPDHRSILSPIKMRQLQPKVAAIKAKYGDDTKDMSEAVAELYSQENVGFFGGCLPTILQILVYITLFFAVSDAIALRQAPFVFWIHDLAAKDPYYILPILAAACLWAQQLFAETPAKKAQHIIKLLLPVLILVIFSFLPAGFVLFALTMNLFQLIHQWIAINYCVTNE